MQRALPIAMGLAAVLSTAAARAQSTPDWQVAGRLGLATFIVVPETAAADPLYYDRAIAALCPAEASCWLRFFTNTSGAALGLPLPEAIEREPTAIFQRSAKNGGRTMFRWACRLQGPGGGDCF
ncbi:hypothetical protein [Caldimonas sp. KR1-144]|uniref:hypothetical protein n=1 Tax=Caldimonas sp. KR1-144 TaxID=3400911 RepID=UPI003C02342F